MVAAGSVPFGNLPLDPKLLRALEKCELHTTTQVQGESIPKALEGRDLVVRARTGSGKTLAYVLPALHKVLSLPQQQQRPSWQAIILVPTRELCKQVKEEADRVVEKCGGHIKVTALTGEGSEAAQRNTLLTIGQLVVSTPGRIAQALRAGQLQPSMLALQPKAGRPGLSTLVLDEADLMLSMPGYETDLRDIIPKLPSSCQRILMSATTSPEVESLMRLALTNPLSLNLTSPAAGPSGDAGHEGGENEPSTSGRIDHFSFSCARQDKMLAVLSLLKLGLVSKKVLLFTNSVEPAFRLRLFLEAFGLRAALLSPDLPLNTRHHILQTFNKGLFDYLIAADTQVAGLGVHAAQPPPVADAAPAKDRSDKRRKRKREGAEDDAEYGVSRGIDFKGVSTVINVDCPPEVSKYVHRVGRTGRAGHSGTALTLLLPDDKKMQAELEATLAGAPANAAAEQHGTDAASGEGGPSESGLRPFSALKPAALDALRYRAEDVARSLTKTVIQEARAKELRAELLNSKRLEAHFEAHPGDLQLLQHDHPLAKRAAAPHLKHIPAYLRAAAGPAGKLSAAAARSLSGKGKGQGKRRADPLKEGYARLARMDHDDQKHGPLTDAEKAAAKIKPKKKAGQAKFQPKRNVRKGVRRR